MLFLVYYGVVSLRVVIFCVWVCGVSVGEWVRVVFICVFFKDFLGYLFVHILCGVVWLWLRLSCWCCFGWWHTLLRRRHRVLLCWLVRRQILGNDTTPTFTVTVGETGGTVTLYANSDCSTAASSATTVTDNASPYTVSVTATALTSDGAKRFYAKHTNSSNEASGCSSVLARYYLDTTNPTANISEVSGGYISSTEDDADVAIEVPVGAGVETVSLSLSDGTDTISKNNGARIHLYGAGGQWN